MSFLLTFLVCSLLGTLSGLGIGGGSLMMVFLTFICHLDFPQARFINLIFFLASAACSVAIQLIRKQHHSSHLILPAFVGALSAGFFTFLCKSWDTSYLRKAFGILLIITAIRQIRTAKQ